MLVGFLHFEKKRILLFIHLGIFSINLLVYLLFLLHLLISIDMMYYFWVSDILYYIFIYLAAQWVLHVCVSFWITYFSISWLIHWFVYLFIHFFLRKTQTSKTPSGIFAPQFGGLQDDDDPRWTGKFLVWLSFDSLSQRVQKGRVELSKCRRTSSSSGSWMNSGSFPKKCLWSHVLVH